jgi:hypothetical protein
VDIIELDRLELIIEAEARKANAELDKLTGKLNQISTALNGLNTKGLNNLSLGIQQLSSAMSNMSGVKTTDFNRLVNNINKIGAIDQGKLYQISNALRNLVNTVNSMGSVSDDAVRIGELASNISRLGGASAQRAIANLPLLSIALKEFMTTLSTSPFVSQNLINMTNAMANLASQGSKYGSSIKGIAVATNTLTKSQEKAKISSTSLMSAVSKLAFAYFTLKKAIGFISNSIEKSMDYTETINLFQTTYKKIGMETAQDIGMEWGSATADAFAKGFIKDAESFNDMLVNSLGLDPNVMKQYQAIFAQMTNSMGLVAQSSMNIADSFTMLGNDIASLWNIDTADAMKKLQSGLAGQIRPLRSLGIDISQTSLEMTALKYGITDSVVSMSQAAKVQLRWLSIMDQTEVAFGDMAKTIESPKNQLRILSQQWSNLSRSIGNVFLPIVSKLLPYINAIVVSLRKMMDSLAAAMGYELPDYSDSNIYSDLTGDIDGMTDATEDATAAADKLKKSVMSFDNLNILSKGQSSTDTAGEGYSELDDAIQQKTDSYLAKFNEEMSKMNDWSAGLGDKLKPVSDALDELWKSVKPFADNVGNGLQWFYDEVLVPVSEITINETVPEFLYAVQSAIDAINTAIDKFKSSGNDKTFGDFISSMYKLTAGDTGEWFKSIGDAFVALDNFLKNPNFENLLQIFTQGGEAAVKSPLTLPMQTVENTFETLTGFDVEKWYTENVEPWFTAEKWNTTFENVKEAVSTWVGKVVEWFGAIGPSFVKKGKYIIDGIKKGWNDNKEKFIEWVGGLIPNILTWFGNMGSSFIQKGRDIIQGIEDGWAEKAKEFGEWLGGLPKNIGLWFGNLKEKFITKGAAIISGIKKGWNDGVEDFKEWLAKIPGIIFNAVGSVYILFKTKGKDIMDGIKQGWTDGWEDFKTWLATLPSQILGAIGDFYSMGKTLMENFLSGFKSGLTGNSGTGKTSNVGTGVTGSSSTKIKKWAVGGYPTPGELFFARENGIPELVGQMGSRTAVANNTQIEAGIEEASYRGYMRAIMDSRGSTSNQTGPIILKTTDREIARSTNVGNQNLSGRYNVEYA